MAKNVPAYKSDNVLKIFIVMYFMKNDISKSFQNV